MTWCADCVGHEGVREFAIGWVDDRNIEHRREYMTLCGCPAGAELHASSCKEPKDGVTPHKRVSFQKAHAGWTAYLAAKGWGMIGWWVTSRTMLRLPEEARFTAEQRERIDNNRAAYRAAKEHEMMPEQDAGGGAR